VGADGSEVARGKVRGESQAKTNEQVRRHDKQCCYDSYDDAKKQAVKHHSWFGCILLLRSLVTSIFEVHFAAAGSNSQNYCVPKHTSPGKQGEPSTTTPYLSNKQLDCFN
jgi:hypothetical protein